MRTPLVRNSMYNKETAELSPTLNRRVCVHMYLVRVALVRFTDVMYIRKSNGKIHIPDGTFVINLEMTFQDGISHERAHSDKFRSSFSPKSIRRFELRSGLERIKILLLEYFQRVSENFRAGLNRRFELMRHFFAVPVSIFIFHKCTFILYAYVERILYYGGSGVLD